MTEHNETLFQRVNQARAKFVSALRIALNATGMREKGPAPIYNLHPRDMQGGVLGLQQTAPVEGYDIEKVIQAATALRAALEPFDSSIPRAKEQK